MDLQIQRAKDFLNKAEAMGFTALQAVKNTTGGWTPSPQGKAKQEQIMDLLRRAKVLQQEAYRELAVLQDMLGDELEY